MRENFAFIPRSGCGGEAHEFERDRSKAERTADMDAT